MKKLMFAFVSALTLSLGAFAAEAAGALEKAQPPGETAQVAEEPEVEVEEEESSFFSCGVDLDLFSAYIWRNAVMHDELVFQPAVWAEFNVNDWFRIGAYVWQNWDMTTYRRQTAGVPMVMNETDYGVYIGRSLWESDDGEYVLDLEIGNEFFTYRQIEDCPNSYEFYIKLRFDNPFVGVYGQYSQAYNPVVAPYFELGLNKEINIGEAFGSESDFLNRWTVGAEWSLSFASGKYFTNYLYGSLPQGEYDPELEEYEDERNMSNGIGGTTLKGVVAYQVCDHFSLGLMIAYTAALSGEAIEAINYAENGNLYKRLVWGGIQAKLDF